MKIIYECDFCEMQHTDCKDIYACELCGIEICSTCDYMDAHICIACQGKREHEAEAKENAKEIDD